MIQASDLCQYAKNAVGGGYCWGASGEICLPRLRQELAMRVDPKSTSYGYLLGLCAKWDGKKVWDCSGIFRGAYKALGLKKSGGATTIFNTWLLESGPIGTMPDEPGIALFKGTATNKEHIGLYIGNGQVIDARGAAKGVLIGPITDYAWLYWGRLADVVYAAYEGVPVSNDDPDVLYQARIVNVKTGLNLRTTPVNSVNTILLIPPNAVADVLEERCGDGSFAKVRYFGTIGYCTRSYLYQLDTDDEGDNG